MAKACAITLGLVMCVPVVDALGFAGEQEAGGAVQAGIDARAIIGDGDPYGFVDRMNDAVKTEGVTLPSAFAAEIGIPSDARDIRVDSTGAIVGYVVDVPADEANAAVSARMKERGWNEVALGAVEGSTYMKNSGSCTWALVTCTQVGEATNVVFRSVYR